MTTKISNWVSSVSGFGSNVITDSPYQMWMTWNAEKQKIQLPVLPEEIKIKNSSNNDTVDVAGLGEIVIMQSRKALLFSFSSFFPAASFPGIKVSKITEPRVLVRQITEWKKSTTPIHFLCTDVGIDIYCSIESFDYEEVGGDPGTYQYDITLKEYREISTRKVTVNVKTSKATVKKKETRVESASKPKTYTVKKGDCLWNIAKKYYGSGSKYTVIYNANKSVIGGNPNLIYPGQVLTIPDS